MENEQQPLSKALITYSAQEFKDGEFPRTIIKDQDGKKYLVWHKKKDGSSTKAFEQLGTMNMGQKTGLAFKTEMRKFTDKKTGKEVEYPSRTVAYFADVPQDAPIKPEFQFKTDTQVPPTNPVEAKNEPQSEPLPPETSEISVDEIPF